MQWNVLFSVYQNMTRFPSKIDAWQEWCDLQGDFVSSLQQLFNWSGATSVDEGLDAAIKDMNLKGMIGWSFKNHKQNVFNVDAFICQYFCWLVKLMMIYHCKRWMNISKLL